MNPRVRLVVASALVVGLFATAWSEEFARRRSYPIASVGVRGYRIVLSEDWARARTETETSRVAPRSRIRFHFLPQATALAIYLPGDVEQRDRVDGFEVRYVTVPGPEGSESPEARRVRAALCNRGVRSARIEADRAAVEGHEGWRMISALLSSLERPTATSDEWLEAAARLPLPDRGSPWIELALRNRSALFERGGDFYSAGEDLEQTIENLQVANLEDRYRLGILRLSDHRHTTAREIFRTITEDSPTYADAWTLLGATEHRFGRRPEAVRALDRALALAPDEIEPRIFRAVVLYEQGDRDAATIEIERAARLIESRDASSDLRRTYEWVRERIAETP